MSENDLSSKDSLAKIIIEFVKHCNDGWSSSFFSSRFKGGSNDVKILREKYPEFDKLFRDQLKKQREKRKRVYV